jgi:hypothetical protein
LTKVERILTVVVVVAIVVVVNVVVVVVGFAWTEVRPVGRNVGCSRGVAGVGIEEPL